MFILCYTYFMVPKERFVISDTDCSVELTLRLIGGKWKTLILWELMIEPTLRHGELKRRMPGVTAKMMVQQLRELEADGAADLVGRAAASAKHAWDSAFKRFPGR